MRAVGGDADGTLPLCVSRLLDSLAAPSTQPHLPAPSTGRELGQWDRSQVQRGAHVTPGPYSEQHGSLPHDGRNRVSSKYLSLGRPDTWFICHTELAAGTSAWWDKATKKVACESRRESPTDEVSSDMPALGHQLNTAPSEPPTIDKGTAGKSSLEEFRRRHDKREARIDAKFGRFAGVVKFLTDDPQSITAWAKGSSRERALAASLEKNLGERAIILSDRRVPKTRGNIDHLIIAPSGVRVVDAKNYSGLVEQRDVGGWFKTDLRLYVSGRDRSKLLDGLAWQVEAVTTVLAGRQVPVSRAVCFTDAEW